MVATIKTYNSVEEIAETIDKEIAYTKSALDHYLSKLDAIRTLAEKSKKIREIVNKLAGKKTGHSENLGEIEVEGLKIILDANASHESTAIEDAVKSYQEYLLALQNAREALKPLNQLGDTEGLKFMVLETRGVPERILLKNF
jgi:predicted transcriptional regulator